MKISLGLPKPLFRLSYMKLELLIFNWEQTGVMSNFWMTVFGLGNLQNVICLSTHQSQITIETHFYFTFKWLLLVQLNEYETDPYFLQLFQSNTAVCLIIYMFCKSCELVENLKLFLKNWGYSSPQNFYTMTLVRDGKRLSIICKRETVWYAELTEQFQVRKILTKHVNKQTNCRIALEILKKIWICLVFI